MRLLSQFFKSNGKTVDDYKAEATQDLMRKELAVTKGIFGPLKPGTKRDFFCLDKHTWVWYEEWTADDGQRKHMTTRYMVRPSEIVKSLNGGPYQRLTAQEARNLKAAAQTYTERVNKHLYSLSNKN